VYQCGHCGHIQLLPKPTPEEDKAFYDNNLQDKHREKKIEYEQLEFNQQADTHRHTDLIETLIPKTASILDIGAGYGFFVKECYRRGYEKVKGLEISDERRAIAQTYTPAEIMPFDVNEGADRIGRYDAITLFHVLEHASDPIPFLKQIGLLLKPSGLLICEVPNVEDLLLGNSPAYHDFYWIRAHLHYFNGKTLTMAFRQAGFQEITTRYAQRYGLLNVSNWLLTGQPQIDRPTFTIAPDYQPIESDYRRMLETKGVSDALLAIASI
jgi:2-polyprenyl-3-methyl-5-hydroxy-6-metoxy-1,4-benzoquinol methylase